MFKPARWWSEKNKLKVVFKLHFHASKVTQVGGDGLMISLVPADAYKLAAKSDKAIVRDGSCFWENPVYETVKFNQDPKSGKINERIYYFVLGTGPSKSGVVGEASIDFSHYAEANRVSLVSLPLKNSKTEATLHVSIQRIQETMDQREVEKSKIAILRPVIGNHDTYETTQDPPFSKIPSQDGLNVNRQASSGSDVTISSSESISSGIETPKFGAPTPTYDEQQGSWEWLGNSAVIITDNSSSTPREESLLRHEQSEEAPDIMIERLKSELSALSRQAEMSELELQTLRKQNAKESKRGQYLWRETVCLKEERDVLMEKLGKTKTSFLFDGVNTGAVVFEELRQELDHAKEMNANLRIQLQKTQESNSELILAVRDLDEILEQRNREMSNTSIIRNEKPQDDAACQPDEQRRSRYTCYDDDDDEEEQRALEDLVKEHGDDAKEGYDLLEQQINDLRDEIEIHKREKDELEMQMEQLALDYEIMKQANHDMSFKLEQSQIREHLNSSSDTSEHEFDDTRMEENDVKKQSNEYEDSLLVRISELEAHAKRLEEELEKQAKGFEADLEAITSSKVEQEKRTIRAEETLKKIRWKNANTAERLQEEFRRLSVQMGSAFEANEKLVNKAMAEANELRLQKIHVEELLRKASEEHLSVKGQYETRLHQLTNQVLLLTDQIEEMEWEMKGRDLQLENQRKHAEEEVLMLRDEIEMHVAKNQFFLEEIEGKKELMHELERMKMVLKETELVVEQGNDERIELESRMKNEDEGTRKELNKMICLVEEKELMVGNLKSEIESLQARCMELEQDEMEKDKLRKQVFQLRNDLKNKEDVIISMEKKMKDAAKATLKSSKPIPSGSKEVGMLKERIKLLESKIKSKETALETSTKAFLDKEKDLHNKIEELEGRLKVQGNAHICENEIVKPADHAKLRDQTANCRLSEEAENGDNNFDELKNEMALLKERNKSMEEELKEMQERYSDISLKFAEVEGERQQLVMKLRRVRDRKSEDDDFTICKQCA